MKKWMEKLIEQFDFDWTEDSHKGGQTPAISEERATLLYMIDTFNKHLIEFEGHPVRKARETLDEYAKQILQPKDENLERVLFRFRQFFSGYRIDEVAYVQKTFEEFRTIIWDFVDQLSEDLNNEQVEDSELRTNLDCLKDAVESNSIDTLKDQSRKFIDCYMEKQFKREKRRSTRMKSVRKNLNVVKKQLIEAVDNARLDHLTKAMNRKSFEEYAQQHMRLFEASKQPLSLMMLDIDHFKRINDTYGHPIGDFVLKELVKSLKDIFQRESDVVARVGGEEFSILLPDYSIEAAKIKAEEVLKKVAANAYAHEGGEIRFTVSIGVAELYDNETKESWIKRCDLALYHSKNTGRNRITIAPSPTLKVA